MTVTFQMDTTDIQDMPPSNGAACGRRPHRRSFSVGAGLRGLERDLPFRELWYERMRMSGVKSLGR